MINDALKFIKGQLNAYLKLKTNSSDTVVFTDKIESDAIIFEKNKVTLLLINIEEDHNMRAPNLYARVNDNGKELVVNPEIRLNLMILFVVNPNTNEDNPGSGYEQATKFLSLVIQFFQSHRLFNHTNSPTLSEEIDHLVTELITLPLNQQNDIWNALRRTHLPSVLYKIKMIRFRDEESIDLVEEIKGIDQEIEELEKEIQQIDQELQEHS